MDSGVVRFVMAELEVFDAVNWFHSRPYFALQQNLLSQTCNILCWLFGVCLHFSTWRNIMFANCLIRAAVSAHILAEKKTYFIRWFFNDFMYKSIYWIKAEGLNLPCEQVYPTLVENKSTQKYMSISWICVMLFATVRQSSVTTTFMSSTDMTPPEHHQFSQWFYVEFLGWRSTFSFTSY